MRKMIIFCTAIITALAAVLQTQLGLTIGLAAAMASIAALITYIFGEAKNDFARIKSLIIQQGKFTDPAFWGAIISGILPVVNSTFGLGLSDQVIISIATVIVGILGVLFAKRQQAIK